MTSATTKRPPTAVLEATRSQSLGDLRVRTDREGVKIYSEGILYAVLPRTLAATPAPWLALGAVPWLCDASPRRVALLGYGGGTLGRLLRNADPHLRLEGVEPDPVMRRLAREHLAARVPGVRLRALDAVTFLKRAEGPGFDAILDDIYAPIGHRLSRPADVEIVPRLARRRLAPGGCFAVSLASPGGGAERRTVASLRRAFRYILQISPWEYAHSIFVGSDRPFLRGALTRALTTLLSRSIRSPSDVGLDRVRRISNLSAHRPGHPSPT